MSRKLLVALWVILPLSCLGHDGLIKSLTITPLDDYWADPIISLGVPGQAVLVEFDQLGDDRSYLRYAVTHCDASWKPSGLVDSEYLDGFNEGTIDDYYYSQATLWPYVHYSFQLPNDQMRLTASGNYEVRIYDEQAPDVTLATARFGVCDNSMKIEADVSPRTDIDSHDGHQQVTLAVDMQQENIRDPFNDLKVVVTQNGQTENEVTISHPMRVQGTKAFFEHLRDLIFNAGNEYHRFEATSTVTPGMHVEHIGFEEPYYFAVLQTDEPRYNRMYLYDETQGGKFLPRSTDVSEPDYMMVLFTLQMPKIQGADVFIDGDLTGRRFTPEARMEYDYENGCYRGQLMLKQGYYEYRYVTVPQLNVPIDGNFSETRNRYMVRVYHRPPGGRYDRLTAYMPLSL